MGSWEMRGDWYLMQLQLMFAGRVYCASILSGWTYDGHAVRVRFIDHSLDAMRAREFFVQITWK